jgi:hypothetical protein
MNCQPQYAEIWQQIVFDTHATVVLRSQAEGAKFAIFRLDTPYALRVQGKPPRPDAKPNVDLDAVVAEAARLSADDPPAAAPDPAPAPPPPSAP